VEALIFIGVSVGFGEAKVYLTHAQALSLAFPKGETVERKTLFLTPDQVKRIEARAGVKVTSQLVTYYQGRWQDQIVGYAFFDSHIVRTKAETFMVAVNPDGTVKFVEILVFDEPEDYLPKKSWLEEFKGKRLEASLRVRRGLSNMAGSTLTSLALTDGVRRVLATVSEVVQKPKGGGERAQ